MQVRRLMRSGSQSAASSDRPPHPCLRPSVNPPFAHSIVPDGQVHVDHYRLVQNTWSPSVVRVRGRLDRAVDEARLPAPEPPRRHLQRLLIAPRGPRIPAKTPCPDSRVRARVLGCVGCVFRRGCHHHYRLLVGKKRRRR